ncbi:hypothetical protein A8139_21470 [Marinomonas primoryensis]|uniref:Uncharacterized protein n=1 Tax=Marinomonas primoryensis TaxID=178399 RepID=A0A2Z4PX66_9GAMM|nr:hypothetical protein [Marinomonas primoryensis]AWX98702.1 hypothetical protein A8139_00865 [Marinomonas primoryensis]AWY02221.1 hypothetical protein A8139_21470 [Marinomonas primoryensis]
MANTHAVRTAAQNALNQPVSVAEYRELLMQVIALATSNLSELETPKYAAAYLNGVGYMIEPRSQS